MKFCLRQKPVTLQWEDENWAEPAQELAAPCSESSPTSAQAADADQVLSDRFGLSPDGVAAMARPWSRTDN